MRKRKTTDPHVSSWHDPSEMQRSGTSETPNNEYAKDRSEEHTSELQSPYRLYE